MAAYATYRHVELDRVGVGKKRVLKPPGGGSSIVFEEDESTKPVKSRPQQQEQQSPPPQASPEPPMEPPKEAPPAEKQPEQPFPKPEINGMSTPDCIKEDAASTTVSNPTPAAATTNGERSPALNGPSAVNGSSTTNGCMSSGTSSSMSMHSGGTPKHLNTQTRIFGAEQGGLTPRRRLRDHERSNIFAGDDAASNGTHRPVFRRPRNRRDPVTGVGVLCWDLHAPRCAPSKWKADLNGSPRNSESTPEPKTPESVQQAPRQRVPPGGFSTKLW
ncbi:uncharacterized protein LOC126998506 isoform X3 [Eriocheir sinensis]|uniref:uncharacterized protein LOC126998506 isoform X3 n=1 Tax=Eriocheir sinensis TaxID=95602 RepID=UPI0021C857C3|nr:uncharacterized protein LOC126998506 isoform X3 [Eriocheir sinensis]